MEPALRAVIVRGLVVPDTVDTPEANVELVDQRAVYEVIVEPFETGAVKETVAVELLTAVTVGAAGALGGA